MSNLVQIIGSIFYPRIRLFPAFYILFRNSKVKLATVVEGDQKAPFSIAATPRCRGGRNSFLWIARLYP